MIFLGRIAGSSPAGKILTCLLPFLTSVLNLCLPLKTATTSPKLENASLTAWSLINSGRKMVTKIGSLPFLRGPTRLWKLSKVQNCQNGIGSLYFPVSPSLLLTRRPKQTLKEKLCTERLFL